MYSVLIQYFVFTYGDSGSVLLHGLVVDYVNFDKNTGKD